MTDRFQRLSLRLLQLPPLIVLFVSIAAQGQEPGEAYPGANSHAHPETYTCERDAKEPARRCDCHRVADPDQMCEDEPAAPTCKVFCWEKLHFVEDAKGHFVDPQTGKRGRLEQSHCHCPIECPMHAQAPLNQSPAPASPEPAAMSYTGHAMHGM